VIGSFWAQHVPGLKNNFLLVLVMEKNYFSMIFQRGKVLILSEGASPDTTLSIGVRDGNLYRLQGKPIQALVHDNDNLCELWHMRMGHIHYRVMSILREVFTGFPEFNVDQQGMCRGCEIGNNSKAYFPSIESRSKGILDILHSYVSGTMSVASV
jgi:hypothetical protein